MSDSNLIHIRRPRLNVSYCGKELYGWDARVDVKDRGKATCEGCRINYELAPEKEKK
jgi:hypothetical protein